MGWGLLGLCLVVPVETVETADADALEAPSPSPKIASVQAFRSCTFCPRAFFPAELRALRMHLHLSPGSILHRSGCWRFAAKEGKNRNGCPHERPDSHGQQAGCLCEIGCVGDYHGLRSTCNVALTGDDSTRACRCLPCLAVHLATSCKRAKDSASLTGLRKSCFLEPTLAWSGREGIETQGLGLGPISAQGQGSRASDGDREDEPLLLMFASKPQTIFFCVPDYGFPACRNSKPASSRTGA